MQLLYQNANTVAVEFSKEEWSILADDTFHSLNEGFSTMEQHESISAIDTKVKS